MAEKERNEFGWKSWNGVVMLARIRPDWRTFVRALCDTVVKKTDDDDDDSCDFVRE